MTTSARDPSCSLECIVALKSKGNEYYKQGVYGQKKMKKVAVGEEHSRQFFVKACLKYAAALEEIASLEYRSSKVSTDSTASLAELKANLFINLSMANFQLHDYNESVRCANAAIAFVNKPSLEFNDLGEENDLNGILTLIEPLMPTKYKLAGKCLFRRAKALVMLGRCDEGYSDVSQAQLLLPNDESIAQLKNEVVQNLDSHAKVINIDESRETQSTEDKFQIVPEMCNNGGFCLMRRGMWSQSIEEVVVQIPLSGIFTSWGADCCNLSIKVTFATRMLEISPVGQDDQRALLGFSRNIKPSESSWYKESIGENTYIVLMLLKAKPTEEYPGCEWWDRVFEDDERIDTMTCSIGSDIAQLPSHAQARAFQQHSIFQSLTPSQQHDQLEAIKSYKKMFMKSETKTRDKALQEDKAIQEVPERAPMLDALRSEFPDIQFSAR